LYIKANRLAEARALAVRQRRIHGKGYLLATTGDVEGARELLRRLDARPPQWGDETERALTYLGLGDTASALSGLERATDAKEVWPTTFMIGDPMYDGVRRTARFRVLLHRVGLDEYVPSLTR
jgi:hypothetical protein